MIASALLRPVADVLKLFGNNGTLIVKFRSHGRTLFTETEPVFAIMDGIPVPFFIASFQTRGNDRAHILFDFIYREAQAHELVGKTLYQPADKNRDKKGGQKNVEDPSVLVGFKAIDLKMGLLGCVKAFMDWRMNPCLSILRTNSTASFFVPFQEAFIDDIDFEAKQIVLTLPDGLVEVTV